MPPKKRTQKKKQPPKKYSKKLIARGLLSSEIKVAEALTRFLREHRVPQIPAKMKAFRPVNPLFRSSW